MAMMLKMMRQIGGSAPLSKLGRNRVAIRFGRHSLTVIFCGVIVFLHAYYCLIALAIGLGDTNSIPNFATLPNFEWPVALPTMRQACQNQVFLVLLPMFAKSKDRHPARVLSQASSPI